MFTTDEQGVCGGRKERRKRTVVLVRGDGGGDEGRERAVRCRLTTDLHSQTISTPFLCVHNRSSLADVGSVLTHTWHHAPCVVSTARATGRCDVTQRHLPFTRKYTRHCVYLSLSRVYVCVCACLILCEYVYINNNYWAWVNPCSDKVKSNPRPTARLTKISDSLRSMWRSIVNSSWRGKTVSRSYH